jgi:acyl-CoA dehydrogenase
MLLVMKSTVEACRALALYAAHQLDLGSAHADAATRAAAQARGDLLIPIVKGFCTESGIEIATLGIQVHGGMGYIEETGAAQTLRDVRITTIYEGTTGIQANDLIGRKIGRDRGAALTAFIDEMQASLEALTTRRAGVLQARNAALDAVARMRNSSAALLAALGTAPDRAMAVAVPFLKMCGLTIGGWLMARAADAASRHLDAGAADADFLNGKIASAHFYGAHVLSQVLGLEQILLQGSDAVVGTDAALI